MPEADQAHGVPYAPGSTQVDEWSQAIYDRLVDWPPASGAKWERWEPGYLVLTITGESSDPFDPIVLYTCEDELAATFGYWETELPSEVPAGIDDADAAVKEAKELVADWLAGRTLTAVYFDASDEWCGSLTVDPAEVFDRLRYGAGWIKDFHPARIELRAARRKDWRHFVIRDGEIHAAQAAPA
ncbi:hypothetical protein [Phenylobacterium aquaticum]|uniref:hypothetical protein n=1 Tax=Phenylobacterium aquaticum TaxID=1763816 RepID=UPI0026EE13A6|nr:hypothetical protein [Phenylobacterium aquaticum]